MHQLFVAHIPFSNLGRVQELQNHADATANTEPKPLLPTLCVYEHATRMGSPTTVAANDRNGLGGRVSDKIASFWSLSRRISTRISLHPRHSKSTNSDLACNGVPERPKSKGWEVHDCRDTFAHRMHAPDARDPSPTANGKPGTPVSCVLPCRSDFQASQ